jgi:hypothetical protein
MQAAVSKGEFARIIGVSPGRVSQYLTEGKISASALVGTGRNAKIIVEQARSDLRLTLDVSQRLGNGIETRLDGEPPAVGQPPGATQPAVFEQRGADYEIKLQKLEELRRRNRNGAIADAKESGILIETSASKAEMGRVAAAMLGVFEGGLTDMAAAIAAKFELPQRDVKHLLRGVFREIRERAATQMLEKAISLDEVVPTVLEADDIDQVLTP